MNRESKTSTGSGEGWWSREHALVLALFAATVLALYVCYLLARPFFPALTWALALAVVANPLYESIVHRIGRANLAAGLAVVIVVVTIDGTFRHLFYSLLFLA